MSLKLTKSQQKLLKKMSHSLKPVVIIGNAGLTDAVISEIDNSIEHHEIIKVRLNASDRDARRSMVNKICEGVHAAVVNQIGHIAVFYRPASKPIIKL